MHHQPHLTYICLLVLFVKHSCHAFVPHLTLNTAVRCLGGDGKVFRNDHPLKSSTSIAPPKMVVVASEFGGIQHAGVLVSDTKASKVRQHFSLSSPRKIILSCCVYGAGTLLFFVNMFRICTERLIYSMCRFTFGWVGLGSCCTENVQSYPTRDFLGTLPRCAKIMAPTFPLFLSPFVKDHAATEVVVFLILICLVVFSY